MTRPSKDPWVKWFPGDFLHGVSDLEANEILVYVIVLNLIYDKEGPWPYNPKRLAARCKLRQAVVEEVVEGLIEYEKLELADGCLTNAKAEKVLGKRQVQSKLASEAAKSRWQDKNGKDKENKEGDDADALRNASGEDANQKLEARNQIPPTPQGGEGSDEFVFEGAPPKERKPRAAPKGDRAMAERAVGLWNEMAAKNDLGQVRWPIADARLAKLYKRLADGGIERWIDAVSRVERSKFLCGESAPRNIGDAPYQAGIDLLLQPSTWDRLHEGKYRLDRTPPQSAADPKTWPQERWDRIHTRFSASGAWPDNAGPKPSEPGYLGPPYRM